MQKHIRRFNSRESVKIRSNEGTVIAGEIRSVEKKREEKHEKIRVHLLFNFFYFLFHYSLVLHFHMYIQYKFACQYAIYDNLEAYLLAFKEKYKIILIVCATSNVLFNFLKVIKK